MKKADPKVKATLQKLAEKLAQQLTTDTNDAQGDGQWAVEGIADRAWKVGHPSLPLVKNDTGKIRDVLLQLHINPPTSYRWRLDDRGAESS